MHVACGIMAFACFVAGLAFTTHGVLAYLSRPVRKPEIPEPRALAAAREAYVEGRIEADEFEERVDAALREPAMSTSDYLASLETDAFIRQYQDNRRSDHLFDMPATETIQQ